MTIRCVYGSDPGFPPTDQHPDAVRSVVAGFVVDHIGAAPTQAEVEAYINPPPSRNDTDALAAKQYTKLQALIAMTPAQVRAWVAANVTTLPQAQDAITTLAIAVSILGRRL